MICPGCQREIPTNAAVCPSCATSLSDSYSPTQLMDREGRAAANKSSRTSRSYSSFDSIDDARFIPGEILAERYRIVGLLGKGGMGEVYRADDLKLGQPVALKFLPDHLLADGAALARFHREVRVARQVSHRNVCRVYDIGEVDGRLFLSMEFIKGEELSSLLRRIGRLPQDKAVQIARQICAGLAAAHDIGFLHRDLKPANIMIDGDGNARILDFGLGGLAGEFGEEEMRAGTPAYMSPEQLEGKEQTVKSDIYSLGLVLYELFTGKRAFEAASLHELIKLRRTEATPTTPTSLVKGLDPLIERIIDLCLQRESALRPSSALQVAAALPGGDPLAAALAAGETPSPEMVAAAPTEGALKPAVALALIAAFLVMMGIVLWLTKYTAVYRQTSLDQPPEALRTRAREITKAFGYSTTPADAADGFVLKTDYLDYLKSIDRSPSRWNRLRTDGVGAYRYWYRQSPRYFDTFDEIQVDRPALDVSGMTSMYLDTDGRLHWFMGVPPQREPTNPSLRAADWSLPFRQAGLDIANFREVPSQFVPLHAYDSRAAWDGADPQHPDLKTHVEAAAFRGQLVYFETIYPWDHPLRQELPPESGSERIFSIMIISVYLIVLVASVLIARRHLRQGAGDRRGAGRVALFYFTVKMGVWLFTEHHNGSLLYEFKVFFFSLSSAVFMAGFLWVLYIAIEPHIRKRWPQRIISWSRLLAGSFRDPMIGRDILLGAVFGAALILLTTFGFICARLFGLPPQLALNPGSELIGSHLFVLKFADQITASLYLAFFAFFILLLLVIFVRRERLALLVLWVLITTLSMLVTQTDIRGTPVVAVYGLLVVFVLYRYGLLALVFAMFLGHLWVFFPMTSEFTAWYAADFVISLVICLALTLYGAYTSLAGQSLFGGKLLGD